MYPWSNILKRKPFFNRYSWFLALKICFENPKIAIFKRSVQNLCDRYGKTIWLGFISEQNCTSYSMHPLNFKSLRDSRRKARRNLPRKPSISCYVLFRLLYPERPLIEAGEVFLALGLLWLPALSHHPGGGSQKPQTIVFDPYWFHHHHPDAQWSQIG